MDPWGLLDSQPALIHKTQAKEKPCLKKSRWSGSKKKHLRLFSGLLDMCTRIQQSGFSLDSEDYGH